MRTSLIVISTALAIVATINAEDASSSFNKKAKRGVGHYNHHQQGLNLDPFNGLPGLGVPLWNPVQFSTPLWDPTVTSDLALGQVQLQATHNLALQTLQDPRPSGGTPSIAYSPEVLRAIQSAKEANHNVHLAQHRVDEVKQAAILQQRIALAKESAAREAAHRSEEIAAHAEADARSSAKQLVALQQRLATLKDAVAAAQRVAAARETAAAAAIQRNAADTAAELRKQDVDKQISQSEREAKAKDLVAAKENAISHALHNNAAHKHASSPLHHPWG